MNAPACRVYRPAQYPPSYTAAPTLNSTLRLSLTLTLLLQTPHTLNYRRAARHPNRLRSPFCTKTRTSTAHQQQVHNKSYKWSVGFNVNGRKYVQRYRGPSVDYRMAYIHHIATLTIGGGLMHAQRSTPARCVAAPQCQPTTGPAGLPHPATWASLPDTGAWTVARNCPIAQVRYTYTNGAALSTVRFLLIHYRKPSRQPGYR